MKINKNIHTLKRYFYFEELQSSILDVKVVENELQKNYQTIDETILKQNITRLKIRLEIEIAKYCIILRKMVENEFIHVSDEQRRIINSSIHSTSLLYDDGMIQVRSRTNNQEVSLDELLGYGQQLLKQENII